MDEEWYLPTNGQGKGKARVASPHRGGWLSLSLPQGVLGLVDQDVVPTSHGVLEFELPFSLPHPQVQRDAPEFGNAAGGVQVEVGNEWVSPSWSLHREHPLQAGLVALASTPSEEAPCMVSSPHSVEAFGAAEEPVLVDGKRGN